MVLTEDLLWTIKPERETLKVKTGLMRESKAVIWVMAVTLWFCTESQKNKGYNMKTWIQKMKCSYNKISFHYVILNL